MVYVLLEELLVKIFIYLFTDVFCQWEDILYQQSSYSYIRVNIAVELEIKKYTRPLA